MSDDEFLTLVMSERKQTKRIVASVADVRVRRRAR